MPVHQTLKSYCSIRLVFVASILMLPLLDEVPLAAPFALFHSDGDTRNTSYSRSIRSSSSCRLPQGSSWPSTVSTALTFLLKRNAVLYAVRRGRLLLPDAVLLLHELWFADRPDPTVLLVNNLPHFVHSFCLFDMLHQALLTAQRSGDDTDPDLISPNQFCSLFTLKNSVGDINAAVDDVAFRIVESIGSTQSASVAVVCHQIVPRTVPLPLRHSSSALPRCDTASMLPYAVLEDYPAGTVNRSHP